MKFPTNVHVIVLCPVRVTLHFLPPHFFKKGETVTKEVYLRVLKNVIKSWMKIVASGKSYVFQKDDAPAHTSHLSFKIGRQHCYILVQGILASQKPKFKSLGQLRMDRN